MTHKTPDWHKHIVACCWVSSVKGQRVLIVKPSRFNVKVLVVGQHQLSSYLLLSVYISPNCPRTKNSSASIICLRDRLNIFRHHFQSSLSNRKKKSALSRVSNFGLRSVCRPRVKFSCSIVCVPKFYTVNKLSAG